MIFRIQSYRLFYAEKYFLLSVSLINSIVIGVAKSELNCFGTKTGNVAVMQKLNGKAMYFVINYVFYVPNFFFSGKIESISLKSVCQMVWSKI